MGRPPADHPGLDREAVVQAAAALVNADGDSALTISRLARELGVQPPSLYNHISGLEDLWSELAVLNVKTLGECLADAVLGRSGFEGLMALAQAYRDYVKRYPHLYTATLRVSGNMNQPNPALAAAEERVVQIALVLVASFGIEGKDAVHIVRGLRSAVHGFAALEVAGGFGIPLDLDESFRRLIQTIGREMQSFQTQISGDRLALTENGGVLSLDIDQTGSPQNNQSHHKKRKKRRDKK